METFELTLELREKENDRMRQEEYERRSNARRKHRRAYALPLSRMVFIVAVTLLGTLLYCLFAEPQIEIVEDPVYSAPTSRQSEVINNYKTAEAQNGNGDTKSVAIDQSDWYVDGNNITVGTSHTVAEGVTVSTDGSTLPLEDTAYIVNLHGMYTQAYADLINAEKEFGSTATYKDPSEYATEQLKLSNAFGYGRAGTNSSGTLGGPVGPAVATRNFYDNYGILPRDEYTLSPHGITWTGSGWTRYKFNIMMVNGLDNFNKYISGETVPVYYVEWVNIDSKGHTAPWGLGQTYMKFNRDEIHTGTTSNMDGILSGSQISRSESDSAYELLIREMTAIKNTGSSNAYYFPWVEEKIIPYGTNEPGLPSEAFSAFEVYGWEYFRNLKAWAESVAGDADNMYVVGVLFPKYDK